MHREFSLKEFSSRDMKTESARCGVAAKLPSADSRIKQQTLRTLTPRTMNVSLPEVGGERISDRADESKWFCTLPRSRHRQKRRT
jgi:hypothetical protein